MVVAHWCGGLSFMAESHCCQIWDGMGRMAVQALSGSPWLWALEEHFFGMGSLLGEGRILGWWGISGQILD